MSSKDERGAPNRQGYPDRTVQPQKLIRIMGPYILLNLGTRDPGSGASQERGSFLSMRVSFYSPGINSDSSDMIFIN